MRQQYTLSAASRNLKVDRIWSLTEEQAYNIIKAVRFTATNGRPICPRCGDEHIWTFKNGKFRCATCLKHFSVTSGTLWAGLKMPYKRLLLLTAYFVMNAHGRASNRLGRDIGLSPMATYVASQKIREALGAAERALTLQGRIEVDGCYIGGHIKVRNAAPEGKKRPRPTNPATRSVICAARERRGRVITAICNHERDFIDVIKERVAPDARLTSDQASHWEKLGDTFVVTDIINHSEHYWKDGVTTNSVESHFARVRRGQRGVYLKIADNHRDLYAIEQAWRTTTCRVSDAERYLAVLRLCLTHPVSRRFAGYWQRGPR